MTFPSVARPSSPTGALQEVAVRYGVVIDPGVLGEMAAAALEFADDECRVGAEVAPEFWPEAQDMVLTRLRRQLAVHLMEAGVLPVALPREIITPTSGHPWEQVKVELVVPTRHPDPV